MQKISKYILIAALTLSACSKPQQTTTTTTTITTTATESSTPAASAEATASATLPAADAGWHHCTAAVDCILIKANDCAFSVDARFEKQARTYYRNISCSIGPRDPEAICKNNYCQIKSR